MSIFSERLKWLRERNRFTQQEMSDKLGLSRFSYAKYEYGQREPTIETLRKLPDILGESVDFIIGATDLDQEVEKELGRLYIAIEEAKTAYDTYLMHKSSLLTADAEKDPKLFEIARLQLEYLGEKFPSIYKKSKGLKDSIIRKMDEIPCLPDELKKKVEKLSEIKIFDNPEIIEMIAEKSKDPQ